MHPGSALFPHLVVLALILAPRPGPAATPPQDARAQIKQIEIDNLTRRARRRIADAQRRMAEYLATGKLTPPLPRQPAEAVDPSRPWPAVDVEARPTRVAAPVPNVRINDPSGDDPNASQNEPSMAVHGSNVLAAWNDWPNLTFLGSLQGYGYASDGGQTFVDGGVIPSPSGTQWHSDPVVTVNEKTGDFYYCGLIESSGGVDMNGVAVLRGTFSGGALVWGTPQTVRIELTSQHFIDKPWIVADSLTGNLYITYSDFTPGSNQLAFQRSTNQGVNWGPAIVLNRPAAAGLVQGSRPAVGPGGEVYAVWKEIGTVDVDFFRIRVSTNLGLTFEDERTVASIFDNFGTGAPGFNRERGVTFPSIAVDRTNGPERGRLYVSWNESMNWLDDPPGFGTTRSETENNNSFARANGFVIGEALIGSFSSIQDFDTFSFQAIEGTSYIFWCDNAPTSLYRMRIFCGDTITKLTFTGHLDPPVDSQNNQSIMVWTAPTSGTYYLDMDYVHFGNSTPGSYRIRTGIADAGSERGRDQRDVFVASSADGNTWSTPVRVNDDPPRFDNWLPEVAVAADGNLYAIWYDWRDTPSINCGGMSHVYIARSDNFGATWVALGPITSTQTDWSLVDSNLAPNQGDYLSLYANESAAYACWTDGRFENPDIFFAAVPLLPDSLQVTASAAVEPAQVTVTWQFKSGQVVSASAYRRENGAISILGPAQSAGAGALDFVDNTVTSGSVYVYGLRVRVGSEDVFIGEVPVTIPAGRLHARPNPVTSSTGIRYDVAAPGEEVDLVVHDITGRRIRVLVHGFQSAGPHEAIWNREDDDGRTVPAGIYLVRFRHGGRQTSMRVAVVP